MTRDLDALTARTFDLVVVGGGIYGLTIAYDALRKGEAPALPELPIQYADFANWQREQLHGEVLDRSLAYWKRELEGLSLLELPAARRRSARPSHRGKALPIDLPEPLTAALKRMAARENVSLFMLMLAAWILYALRLLHRRAKGDVPRAVVSLIAGISLLDALILAGASAWQLGVTAVIAFGLTLALQRVVAGT